MLCSFINEPLQKRIVDFQELLTFEYVHEGLAW